jgi:hypothetical protein
MNVANMAGINLSIVKKAEFVSKIFEKQMTAAHYK